MSDTPTGGRWLRLRGLIVKESRQVARDPSSIAIALVMPIVLLLLFGYGVSLDARNIGLAVVVDGPTQATESLVASFERSPYFHVTRIADRRTAEAGLVAGDYRGVMVIKDDFTKRLARALEGGGAESAPIQLMVDGTDANTARLTRGYVEGAWATWLTLQGLTEGAATRLAVTAEPRIWFNPEVRSRNFLVPGLMAIIMTLIGTLLTALVVAREWERGTMEALMTTPVTALELLIGKLTPYFLLGMGGMGLSVAMAVFLYDVPFRGSFLVLVGVSAVFLVTALALGLLISTAAKNQFVAGQIALVAAFLPAFMLSGFLFEIGSMPAFVQGLTYLFAARYFVAILQTLFLAGTVWSVILPNLLAMVALATVLLLITARRTTKRLE
ncbi:MAG: ABC transporter permease [Rhodobacterales bacterium]|nr:ABC transporter permease [Rhodobacterales bacterium]